MSEQFIITKETIDKLYDYANAEDAEACIRNIIQKEARPLSSALEESYKNGFNDGQAEGLPEALKADRERIMDIICKTDCDTKTIACKNCIVESLRSEQP